jgi:hypothetical protein
MSDDLNPGRDLRAECKRVVLDAVAAAQEESSKSKGIDTIMKAVDLWIGSTDWVRSMTGKPTPIRPDSAFHGVSDALVELQPSQLTLRHSLALLTVCYGVRNRIPDYANFFYRLKAYLEAERPGDLDAIRGLDP